MASVVGVDLGTADPPATLGGYTMNPFEPGPITGESFTASIILGYGLGGWYSWGQNYTGDVHVVTGATPLTISLSGVSAVDFYEEPNTYSDLSMTAVDSSGATVTTVVNGYFGSSGVGFYETNPADRLTSITVTCTDPTGFAVGEFAVDKGTPKPALGVSGVPEPSMLVIFGSLSILGLAWWRRRKAA